MLLKAEASPQYLQPQGRVSTSGGSSGHSDARLRRWFSGPRGRSVPGWLEQWRTQREATTAPCKDQMLSHVFSDSGSWDKDLLEL